MKLGREERIERLKRHVLEEFETETTQAIYLEFGRRGLWAKERELIEKYFAPGSRVLDLGCGTGRTTIPLAEMKYDVVGIDISSRMIENAKKLTRERGLGVRFEVGDATALPFDDETWDNALFSNQGWCQIPGEANRVQALDEARRVLVPGGFYIFTVHPRLRSVRWFLFWSWQWLRLHALKPVGFAISEVDFGDRFFLRESHRQPQYIHIPNVEHVKGLVRKAGFRLVECARGPSVTGGSMPVFFVCQKPWRPS